MCIRDQGTFGSVYLGIAKAARDFAINQTRDRTRIPFKQPESYYPGHQFLAAEMDIALNAGWALPKAGGREAGGREQPR